ncbi:MAG: nuclear transport factor 2 family protein [Haloferacaceae archaeon]
MDASDGGPAESGPDEEGPDEGGRGEGPRVDRSADGAGGDAVRTYYAAIDAHEYDRLASVLAPSFVHYRPDRTLDGREAFVAFMREGRPKTDTTHEIRDVYPNGHGVAVRGRLLDASGEVLFEFVDVFSTGDDGRLRAAYTYTT